MSGILSRIIKRFFPSIGKGATGAGRWMTLLNIASPTSKLGTADKQLDSYKNHVYKVVTLIKNRVTSLHWHLVIKQGNEEAEINDHPFFELANNPNNIWSFSEMLGFTMMHLDLTGRAFWRILTDVTGLPSAIWPLIPSNFADLKVNEDEMKILGYEFYRMEEGSQRFRKIIYAAEEVVDYRYQHPVFLLQGASPIQAMALSYDTDLAIRVQQRLFFENSARPDMVFETEEAISKENADRFLAEWEERHQGVGSRWKPALLGEGLKAHVLQLSNTDLELMGLMKFTKQDILEAYNVPEGILGTVTDVNRANQFGIDKVFNRECIAPRLALLENVISSQLLSKYDPGLRIVFENPIPQDREFELKERESNIKNGYRTINEEREAKGLETVEWGDQPWFPINMIQTGGNGGSNGQGLPGQLSFDAIAGTGKGEGNKQVADSDLFAVQERQVEQWKKPLERFILRWLKDLQKEVNAKIREFWPRIEGITSGMGKKKVNQWIDKNKDLVDDINFNNPEAKKRMIEEGIPLIRETATLGGEWALEFVGAGAIEFDLEVPAIQQMLNVRQNLLVEISDEIFEKIRTSVREGIRLGEGITQIQSRLLDDVWDEGPVRSLKVARTETHTVATSAKLEGYKQSGVVQTKGWLAGSGARDTHSSAGATYTRDGAIPVDNDFRVGAGSGPSPGNIGLPEEDINCFPGDSFVVSPGNVESVFKRFYSGTVVEITTADGVNFTATPNHPVMTDYGWLRIGDVKEGQNIVSCSFSELIKGSYPNINNSPMRLGKVFDLASITESSKGIGGIDQQFHGDGFNADVNIVSTNGLLQNTFQASVIQPTHEQPFTLADLGKSPLLTQSFSMNDILRLLFPFHGSIGSRDILLSLRESHFCHSNFIGITPSSWDYIGLDQDLPDCGSRTMELIGQELFGFPINISFDEVIRVNVGSFAGHVYNLQTGMDWYLVNDNLSRDIGIVKGVIAHNCRCSLLPIVRTE